jgi:hypothetical protein
MMGATYRTDLRTWLFVSLILHLLLLALPQRLFELVFPERPEEVHVIPGDLTPDFQEIALNDIRISVDEVSAPPEILPAEETDPAVEPEPSLSMDGTGALPEGSGSGAPDYHVDTRFFPPVPRLIVPPNLDDMGIATIAIEIRILVGVDGRPVRIEIPDTLASREMRAILVESAARFRFEPARMGDLPVPAWISLPLELRGSQSP